MAIIAVNCTQVLFLIVRLSARNGNYKLIKRITGSIWGNINQLKRFENNISLIPYSFHGNTNIGSLINSSASIKNAYRRFAELDHKMVKRILKLRR